MVEAIGRPDDGLISYDQRSSEHCNRITRTGIVMVELATPPVILHTFQAVEHDQAISFRFVLRQVVRRTGPLLQNKQHFMQRKQLLDSWRALDPPLQRLEERVGIGSIVEREDERAVRRRQRRVLVHLRVPPGSLLRNRSATAVFPAPPMPINVHTPRPPVA